MIDQAHLGRPAVDAPLGDRNANPSGVGLLELWAEDLRTHGGDLLSPGFWAVAVHRFGNWRMSVPWKPLRAPLTAAYRAAYRGVIALWGIDLPYNVKIGRRMRLGHHGCMILGASEFGDDVTVQHTVTVGLSRRTESKVPKIGNRVEIGPRACIVGGITVGDGCFVGANTVVNRSLPPGSNVIGIPLRFTAAEGTETNSESTEPERRRF
jgi:serine O-acetyltransferase